MYSVWNLYISKVYYCICCIRCRALLDQTPTNRSASDIGVTYQKKPSIYTLRSINFILFWMMRHIFTHPSDLTQLIILIMKEKENSFRAFHVYCQCVLYAILSLSVCECGFKWCACVYEMCRINSTYACCIVYFNVYLKYASL